MTRTGKLLAALLIVVLVAPITAGASTPHRHHRVPTCKLHHVYQTGPYLLTAAKNLVVDDPCVPRENAAVQVQNYSGFSLNAQISGANVTIPPYTAVTLNEGGAYQLTISPTAILSNFGGEVLLVWLQPGESPPVADGVLFQGNTNQGGLQWVTGVVTHSVSNTVVLTAPPTGYAYRLHSLTIISGPGNAGDFLQVFGEPIASVFFAMNIPTTGTFVGQSFLLNGQLIAQAIEFQYIGNTASVYSIYLFYDLVQI